jgi:hypothetical protein
MANKFIAVMKTNKNWLMVSLYIIAIALFTITFFLNFSGGHYRSSQPIYFSGLIILFIAMLNTWANRKRKYYIILMAISILLFVLIFMIGVGDLVQIQSKYQIPGHWAEDMAWSIGGIVFAGFMAGLVGIFVCIARWR